MNAVVGVLLLAAATIFFSWSYNQLRRPSPSTWAQWDMTAQFIVFAWVAAICTGVGFVAKAVSTFESAPPTSTDYSLIAAIVVVAVLLRTLLKRQWRRLNAEAGAASGEGTRPAMPHIIATASPSKPDGRSPSHTPKAA